MTTNNNQPTNEELGRKLEEIKNALNLQTKTTSVFDNIDERLKKIETELNNVHDARNRDTLKTAWLAIAIMGWGAMVAAFVAMPESIASISLKWIVFVVGILGILLAYFKIQDLRTGIINELKKTSTQTVSCQKASKEKKWSPFGISIWVVGFTLLAEGLIELLTAFGVWLHKDWSTSITRGATYILIAFVIIYIANKDSRSKNP